MRYNVNNSFNPIVTDSANSNNYTNPQGRIFTIVGTAGARLFPLYGHAPYIATQYIGHGLLDVTMTNNGKTLNAKFYVNDGSVKDRFTINKHG
jgi:hypothetical protein